jgi:4-amino-4-deoxy-L-arabinose transferase-like glycosyltransferase
VDATVSPNRQAAYLIALAALAVRVAYALSQQVLLDDAVHYITVAKQIARNDWASVDAYWFTPYSLILAGIHALLPVSWIGLSRAVCVAAGTLTVLLVGWAGWRQVGATAALVAAAILAVHQRMVRVATDGRTEALYILLAVATAFAVLHARDSGRPARFVPAGLLLGACFLQRQETGLLVVAGMGALALADVLSRRASWRTWLVWGGVTLASAAALTAVYQAAVGPRIEGDLLFAKASNVARDGDGALGFVRLGPPDAEGLAQPSHEAPSSSAIEVLEQVVERYPANAQRVPHAAGTTLLHPLLPVFALAGAWIGRNTRRGPVVFVLALALLPLAAYPAAQLVGRYFIQVVPWFALLAGIAVARIMERWSGRGPRAALLSVLLVPLAAVTVYAAVTRASVQVEFRELAYWIDRELAAEATAGELVVVTQSPELDLYSKLARRQRLVWQPDVCALAAWMRSEGLRWIALDQRHTWRGLPQYRLLLTSPDPAGFTVVKEIRTSKNLVRLLREDGAGCP